MFRKPNDRPVLEATAYYPYNTVDLHSACQWFIAGARETMRAGD
jgi:hypothetical protein